MIGTMAVVAFQLALPPAQALEQALDAVEPPPALRASFRATISSGPASRHIQFDPYLPPGEQFQVTWRFGDDPELDAVVEGWRAERQADVRLFADDLRASLGDARIVSERDGWSIQFRHRISPNDGAVDAAISSAMVGRLAFDSSNGLLSEVDYGLVRPIRLDDGTTLRTYRQTYRFGHSERWGVSFVSSYELEARGGRWGFNESRRVKVTLTDVSFALAGDAGQQLATKTGEPRRSFGAGMP